MAGFCCWLLLLLFRFCCCSSSELLFSTLGNNSPGHYVCYVGQESSVVLAGRASILPLSFVIGLHAWPVISLKLNPIPDPSPLDRLPSSPPVSHLFVDVRRRSVARRRWGHYSQALIASATNLSWPARTSVGVLTKVKVKVCQMRRLGCGRYLTRWLRRWKGRCPR